MLQGLKNRASALALSGALVVGVSAPAFATGVDYSSLTSAVDFSTTTTAVMTVFAALALVYVAVKGARIIIKALR